MKNLFRILGVFFLIFLILCVRNFQEELFYDPYLKFFENKELYKNKVLNDFTFKIMIDLGYRYLLNSILTLLIIYFIFYKTTYFFQSLFVLLMVFVILFPVYYYFVELDFKEYTLFGFYIRRILIQPIVLLLLIPSFYYLENK